MNKLRSYSVWRIPYDSMRTAGHDDAVAAQPCRSPKQEAPRRVMSDDFLLVGRANRSSLFRCEINFLQLR
jgi:hypothetical protein